MVPRVWCSAVCVGVLLSAAWPAQAAGEPDILLTTDRVLYQPGQRIQLRVLVLDRTTRRALSRRQVSLSVRHDAAGVLLSRKLLTNRFGVAAAALPLDTEAPVGRYEATARSGSCVVRKALRVREYQLPRLEIKVEPAARYLAPGGSLKLQVKARYQHGSPVAGGAVEVTATTLVGTEARDFARVKLGLDSSGRGMFRITAPDYLKQTGPALPDHATLSLRVAVTDPGGHREEVVRALPLARQPLLLGAHWLHPPLAKVKNRLALTAQHPDGSPADVQLTVTPGPGRQVKARTGGDGVVLVDLLLDRPEQVKVSAPCGEDRCSLTASAEVGGQAAHRLGLVVERPVVRAGEPIKVSLRAATAGGTVDLMMTARGRLLHRQTVRMRIRQVQATLPSPPGAYGLTTVTAVRRGRVTRSRVLLLGHSSVTVQLKVTPQRTTPGGEVTLTLTARDGQGKPVAAAMEVAVLDRGIYALSGQGLSGREPLFARLPGPVLERLSSANLRWPTRGTGALQDPQFQQAMSLLLAGLPGSADLATWVPPPAGSAASAAPPPWLASLASLLRRLPGASGSAVSYAAVRFAGPALGLLLVLLVVLRRRQLRGRVPVVLLSLYALALLALPWVPWSSAPRLSPLPFEPSESGEDLADAFQAGLQRALINPRRFEGLHPLAVDPRQADVPHDRFPPMVGPLVEITPRHIAVNGRSVVPIKDFAVVPKYKRDGASGYLIMPLLEALQGVTEGLKQVERIEGRRRSFYGFATFIVHPGAPYRLVSEVLYTAGQAEYGVYGLVRLEQLRVVTPGAKVRLRSLLLMGLLLVALLVLMIKRRLGAPAYLAVLVLAGYCGLHYLLQAYPFDDRAALRFPLEEGLRALHPWIAAVVGLALAWQALRLRRPPPSALGALALVVGLLWVPLSRDHGMYYDTRDLRTIQAPRYGEGSVGGLKMGSPGSAGGAARDPGRTSKRSAFVRRYFPETLHYDPLVTTDGQGRATRRLRLGHQLTTWKATALANTQAGAMALARADAITTQQLQVELELPPRLTVGDLLHLPVSVYNHGQQPARVELELVQAAWFEALTPRKEVLRLAAGSGGLAYLPLRVRAAGDHRLQARASSAHAQDAVERPVQVVSAGGVTVAQTAAAWQQGTTQTPASVLLPPDAVPGTARLSVTLLPDLVAQMAAGMEGLLRMPHGCAEQTISSTLPNVMLLAAFPGLAKARPRVARLARDNATKGFQRLLRYERPGGGFSLWGTGEADPLLSALALELLAPLQQVAGVGGSRMASTAQAALPGLNPTLPPRRLAAVARSLARAARASRILPVSRQLRGALVRLIPLARRSRDPYLIALVAGALQDLGGDAQTVDALASRLSGLGRKLRHKGTFWSGRATPGGSVARGAVIETTALAATVLLRAGRKTEVQQALLWLALNRGAGGAWLASQDTLRVLELLGEVARRRGPRRPGALPAPVLNGQRLDLAAASKASGGGLVLQATRLARAGANTLTLSAGAGQAGVALARLSYRVPWAAAGGHAGGDSLALEATYSSTEVRLLERITARYRVRNKGTRVRMPMLRFQVPPGFEVYRADLSALVKRGVIRRHQRDGADVVLYLPAMALGQVLEVKVPLLARAPVEAAAPGAMVYSYYDPSNKHLVRSTQLKVLRARPEQARVGRGVASTAATVQRLEGAPLKLDRRPPGRRWQGPLNATMGQIMVKRWYEGWPSLYYRVFKQRTVRTCGAQCQRTRAAHRRARLAKMVAKMGVLKLLGTPGGTGDRGVADLLRDSAGVTIRLGGGPGYLQLPGRIRLGLSAGDFREVFPSMAPADLRSGWTLEQTIHGVHGRWSFRFARGKLRAATWTATARKANAVLYKRYLDTLRSLVKDYTGQYGEPTARRAGPPAWKIPARAHLARWRSSKARLWVKLTTGGTKQRPRCVLRIGLD